MLDKTKVRFGRRRPASIGNSSIKLRYFGTYATALPTPPSSSSYSGGRAAGVLSQIYLNDDEGDCVIAGGYHYLGMAQANAGSQILIASPTQINADYSAIGGYVPGDPSTDNGCDEQTALNYWVKKGFANGDKLVGWLAIDATNQLHVQQALWLFESNYFGVELPDAWVNPFPSAPGFTWDDGTPDPNNGHCFIGTGYNTSGVQIDTWGMIGTITWKAVAHLASPSSGGMLYVMLSQDIINKAQNKAPVGFDWMTLLADFDALGGNIPIPAPAPPAPTPPVPTPPSPTPPVAKTHTLAEVETILAKGW